MKYRKPQAGFTLIEMIVSLGVFSVVVTISVGALLILIASNRQLQEEQSVLSNLAFALDSMTREIRTGSQYYCAQANSVNSAVNVGVGNNVRIFASNGGNRDIDDIDSPPNFAANDCPSGRTNDVQGVAFVEGGNSITGTAVNRILYYFDSADTKIYRRVGANDPQSIVSDGIYIVNAEFFVTGSEPLSNSASTDDNQASVTIIIEAAADDPALVPDTKIYTIQTSVVQRTLDI